MVDQLQLIAYLSCFLVSSGLYLVLTRFKAIVVLVGLELISNGLSILFVLFCINDKDYNGGIMAIILLTFASINVTIILAILVALHKYKQASELQKITEFKG